VSRGDRVLLGLAVCTVLHATGACAGDQPPVWGAAQNPEFKDLREPASLSTWSFPVPASFRPLDLRVPNDVRAPTVPVTEEFRARPKAARPADSEADTESMIRDTTVWQRLAEFRARNSVRLVTLWETGRNSLSLQAGRRGDPTLQWTSRLSSHGAATSGLLDELFSTSVGGVGGAVGRSLNLAHPSTSEPGGKPGKSMDAAFAGTAVGPTR
jgi:hypothetical protein